MGLARKARRRGCGSKDSLLTLLLDMPMAGIGHLRALASSALNSCTMDF